MSVIYLKNPEGGAKVACSEAEAQYDEANGWRRFSPDDPNAVFPEPVPLPPEPEPQWPVRALALNKDGSERRKPGPKPRAAPKPRTKAH